MSRPSTFTISGPNWTYYGCGGLEKRTFRTSVRTFSEEVSRIEFKHYCKGIYDETQGVPNQDTFVIEMFESSGSSYVFNDRSAYSRSNYAAKLYNGGKPLSGKIRRSFPDPINKSGYAKYLVEHIKKASVRTVMNYFTIPTDADENIEALAMALADQLQIIIHEPDGNADVVATNYQQYLIAPVERGWTPKKPLYDGDAFWVDPQVTVRTHTVDFYERFTHTWKIINTGSVPWKNRKLVCQNADEITPTAEQICIALPDTDPNRSATVAVEFDARGEEETFVSKWFMVNEDDSNCFPEFSGSLNVTIDVRNMRFKRTGGSSIG